MYINRKEDYAFLNIEQLEEKYNARFICCMAMKDKHGNWTDTTGMFFWNDNPKVELGHSNYFAFFRNPINGTVYITNGIFIKDLEFVAVKAKDGEIIYSATNHDYVLSKDKSEFIDGGNDYYRCNVGAEIMKLIIKDGNILNKATNEKLLTEKEYKQFMLEEAKRKEKENIDNLMSTVKVKKTRNRKKV